MVGHQDKSRVIRWDHQGMGIFMPILVLDFAIDLVTCKGQTNSGWLGSIMLPIGCPCNIKEITSFTRYLNK